MPFGRVNIVEFDLVGHRFDASAQGKLVPVACDYRDRLELQAPGQVRMAAPKRSRRRGATFAIIRSVFVKIAVRIEELKRLNRPGFVGGSRSWEIGAMTNHKTSPKFSAEVRERAVRMVFEHRAEHTSQWAAIASIAAKIGCTAQTLSNWVRQAERDQGKRAGSTTDERERIKALERENRELRQANEILRKASAYFAQAELDRRWKP
jgi:transposase-like protein